MFGYQNRLSMTIGWKVINQHIYCKRILAAILDYTFSTNGILLDFYYVVVCNIFDVL